MFYKNSKKLKIACYAVSLPSSGSPLQPKPSGGGALLKAGLVSGAKLITSPPVQLYVGSLLGKIVPIVHEKLVAEKDPRGAAVYVFSALVKGEFKQKSNVHKSVELAAVQSLRLLTPSQRKKVFQQIQAEFGEETLDQVKKLINLRGGGGFSLNYWLNYSTWINFFHNLFFVYLFYSFCKNFLLALNEEMEQNPELLKVYSNWYLLYIVPPNFTIQNSDFMLNFVADDLIFYDFPFSY